MASRLRSVARSGPKRSYRRYYSYSYYRHRWRSSASPPISSSLSLLSRVPVLDLIFSRSCAQSSLRLRRYRFFFRFLLVFFPRPHPPRRRCSDISISLGLTPTRFPTSPRLLLKLCLGTGNICISDWLVYSKTTTIRVCSRALSSLSPFSARRF